MLNKKIIITTDGKISKSYDCSIYLGSNSLYSGFQFDNREAILDCLGDISNLDKYYTCAEDNEPKTALEYLELTCEDLFLCDYEDGEVDEIELNLFNDFETVSEMLEFIDEYLMKY